MKSNDGASIGGSGVGSADHAFGGVQELDGTGRHLPVERTPCPVRHMRRLRTSVHSRGREKNSWIWPSGEKPRRPLSCGQNIRCHELTGGTQCMRRPRRGKSEKESLTDRDLMKKLASRGSALILGQERLSTRGSGYVPPRAARHRGVRPGRRGELRNRPGSSPQVGI